MSHTPAAKTKSVKSTEKADFTLGRLCICTNSLIIKFFSQWNVQFNYNTFYAVIRSVYQNKILENAILGNGIRSGVKMTTDFTLFNQISNTVNYVLRTVWEFVNIFKRSNSAEHKHGIDI